MKQVGLLTIAVIALFSIISSAGAQSTNDTEDCLSFAKISRNDITISWNETCFNDATSYRIEIIVPEQDPCNVDNVPCGGDDLCQTSIQTLACDSSASPCVYVTINVINGDVVKSMSTNFAPYLKSTEWKLDYSSIDVNGMLDARWGPPDSIDYVSCATRAVAVATCNDKEVDRMPWKTDDVLGTQGIATLNVTECTEDIILTVIYTAEVSYLDEDVLTETKSSKTFTVNTPTTPDPVTTTRESYVDPTTESSADLTGAIAGIVIGSLFGTYITNRINI